MKRDPVPAILVHGWNSHPGIWNRLVRRLEPAGVPYSRFSFGTTPAGDIPSLAGVLRDHIESWRDGTGYRGDVDIVCHSIGTMVARWYLEVLDGTGQRERVRQLIGIGPPNNGSALAGMFLDPERGKEVVGMLTGVFVPGGYDPASDRIVLDTRPESRFMASLRSAGLRKDITYRVIASSNPEGIPAFFPAFSGRTWEQDGGGGYRMTCDGDGIIPVRESLLPGIRPDLFLLPPDPSGEYPGAGLYGHVHLPKNPGVIDRIMEYLTAG